MEECERCGESVIRDAKDAHAAIVLRDVFDKPIDGVVGIGGFVCRFGIGEVHVGGEVEGAF